VDEPRTVVTAPTDVVELADGPPRGTILAGKYEVESVLGVGGMGLVLAARHLQLDERIAIKMLRDDAALAPELVERFLREAQAAARLKSEHVARVDDVGTLPDGKPFMVMELLEGLDLGRWLQEAGRIARPHAVDLVLQVCDALAEAHANGIVHRDIKPSNLFVTTRRDGSPLVKVLDFGISKAASSDLSLTQTSSVLGTPAYMSPEQMRSARQADARSDLWSLATVLYELVEGRTPFEASNFAELCVAVATEDPRPLVHAPELAPIIARALEKSPDARFSSIAELAEALAPFTSDVQHADRQVERIFRVLGKAGPLAGARGSAPAIHRARDSASRISRPHASSFEEVSTIASAAPTLAAPRRRRRWLLPASLGLLAACAAVAAIVATADRDPGASAAATNGSATVVMTPATVAAGSGARGSSAVDLSSTPAAAGPDVTRVGSAAAGSDVTREGSDAAGSDAHAGSNALPAEGSATLPHPPAHRPRTHHAPRTYRPRPVHEDSRSAHDPTPPPPKPKPQCDPFANPRGCPHDGGLQQP
jgi:serine/threonine protein kinase